MRTRYGKNQGFTLIELSMVLVVIGLIIGGVLVGQDLIGAAATRATITQVEKYNAVANTFYGKYGGLPGDLLASQASQFGLTTTGCNGSTQGYRNGDGLLDSSYAPYNQLQGEGEVALFWGDLSTAAFIDAAIPSGGGAFSCGNGVSITMYPTTMSLYFPAAKIGHGNFLYVYENAGHNWFGLSALTAVNLARTTSNTTIPVWQAYNIDLKIDDGLPLSGNVQALYLCSTGNPCDAPGVFAADNTPTNCINQVNASIFLYATTVSNGNGINCALSLMMQGAAR